MFFFFFFFFQAEDGIRDLTVTGVQTCALPIFAAWLTIPQMPRRTRTAILAAAVPTIVTVAVEWAGVMQPGNVMRAVAAVPIGAACGWIFVRLLRAEAGPCVIIS